MEGEGGEREEGEEEMGEVVGALRQQKWRRNIGCHDNDAKDIFLKPFYISFTLFRKAYKISKNSV
jgi:hypothetical protein